MTESHLDEELVAYLHYVEEVAVRVRQLIAVGRAHLNLFNFYLIY